MTVNRYTKLIKTLKEAPTNSMGGVYSLNPAGYRLRKPDAPKRFYPTIDGTFPDGIPGNTGDPFYLRPEGFWDGGDDWESYQVSDGSQDYLLDDPTGKSTDGMIAEDGTVKAALPPNSRHFILGPLVDGYVQNHGSDNYTNIGYLQKDTRQFVLLARIQGQFTADLHQEGARVWDGSSGQLTIYNSNFTLAMAEWFRDNITSGSFTRNVPYFYSGGVPQQPISGGPNCPNCAPNMFGGIGPGTNGQFGSGGPGPTLGNGPNPNPESKSGNNQNAGGPFFGLLGGPSRPFGGLLGGLLGGPLGALNDGLNALRKLGDALSDIAPEVEKQFNGVNDGLEVLADVKSAIEIAKEYGGLTPVGSDPDWPDRPGLLPGAPGSSDNPVPKTLSDTTNQTLSNGINSNMTGPELRRQVQSNINNDFNFGAKGTLNNLTSDPYFNDNGDLVIDDTYGFGPEGDIGDKNFPLFGTIEGFANAVSGGNQEIKKDVLTQFDKSLGAVLPYLTPSRKDPIVNIRITVPAGNIKESYRPKFLNNRERQPITEGISNQKRILREIRKPVEIKETPTKYKINFPKQDTSSSQTDELVGRANARGQQWRSDNKRWSGYETTEKDNIIQDRVGHGIQAFDYMIEHGTKRSEWRTKEVQEELNKIAHEKAMLKENPDFKSPFGNVEVSTTEKNNKNFEKVNRIKQVVVDKKVFSNKEIKPEYPSDPVPQPGEVHPKLKSGENAAANYKRLDPISAKSMPDTAYPQIDDLRDKARNKSNAPIKESMTTSAIFSMHLEPSDQVLTQIPSTTISSADNLDSPTEDGIVARVQSFQIVDASKTDTITLNISGSFNTKTVDGYVLSDKVSVGVLVGGTYGGNYLVGGGDNNGLGNGTHTLTIPQKFRKAGVKFDVMQIYAFQGGEGAQSSSVSITGAGLKRLNRMTAFVSLDDPEAAAFIRSTLANENLSPEQKKKKLEEMLGASAEYLTKMFGEGIFTGASEISDVELQQNFADIAKTSDNPNDWPWRGGKPQGPQGPSPDIPWVPTGPRTPLAQQNSTQIAAGGNPRGTGGKSAGDPENVKWPRNRPGGAPPGPGYRPPQAGRRQPQYAHYEPEGEIIVEKKKLKSPASLLDKIPGYYDGKPAPLGFPIEEPPKMKNGMHPDLLDGKKVANRYNRLDPISAKAMPKTGNKHIDSKVAKARSKAK